MKVVGFRGGATHAHVVVVEDISIVVQWFVMTDHVVQAGDCRMEIVQI